MNSSHCAGKGGGRAGSDHLWTSPGVAGRADPGTKRTAPGNFWKSGRRNSPTGTFSGGENCFSGKARPAIMRVCLVSAPTETDLEDSVVLERSGARGRQKDYPLGLLALAAMLEQNAIPVQIVDLNRWYVDFLVSGGTSKGLSYGGYAAARLAELDCPVAGFGSICSSYPLTLRIAEQLKKLRPDTLI